MMAFSACSASVWACFPIINRIKSAFYNDTPRFHGIKSSGLSLLLPLPRRGSGASLQFQTICSSTSSTIQAQANKKVFNFWLCALMAFPLGRSGWAEGEEAVLYIFNKTN
jgi:hypothetical protein